MCRRMSWLALLLLLTATLFACAREGTRQPAPDPNPAPGPAPGIIQSIRVLTYPDHPIDHYLDLLIPAFHEQYGQYRIEKIPFTEQEEIKARVDAKEADIVPISDWLDDSKPLVQDLTPYIGRDRLDLTKYGPGFADLRTDGGIFFLPTTLMPYLILARTESLQAAGVTLPTQGWTWDEFRAAARQLTTRDPQAYGLADSPVDHLAQLWLEGKLGARHWTLTEPDLRAVLSFVQTLAHTDKSLQPPKPATGELHFSIGDQEGFMTGKAAMALGPYAPDMYAQMGLGSVSLAPVPHHPGGRRVSRAMAWSYGMAATTDRPDAAWAFLHFAAGPKGAATLARAGVLPMYQDEAVRSAWLESGAPKATSSFFDTTWHLVFLNNPRTEGHRQTWAYRLELERALHEAMHRVATGEKDVEGAVALYNQRKEEQRRRFPMAER